MCSVGVMTGLIKGVGRMAGQAKRFLDARADMIMVESEGITEDVQCWRTEVPARFASELGIDKARQYLGVTSGSQTSRP